MMTWNHSKLNKPEGQDRWAYERGIGIDFSRPG